MVTTLNTLIWPAILFQQDTCELLLLETAREWSIQTSMLGLLKDCTIIDYRGSYYRIVDEAPITLTTEVAAPSMKQLQQRVQLYASQNGHCCTSKLMFNSVGQLFDMVRFIEHN
ncbi:DUF4144 family protein [Shewanella youngdeokensis]|uniref:DUF4144 family protein n=1 Tax=Shewanella youngdeokensis TaxID=2999068 RepID=A0ABZ0K1B6_9GAMM|nr:DUF4144 family protein [Shewanella sp. DAU334]